MVKNCFLLLCIGMLTGLGSCHSGQQKNQAGDTDSAGVRIQVPVSDTLAAKMGAFLHTYYQLKDAFFKADIMAADEAAARLKENLQAISLHELQADTARYNRARTSLESLEAEISGLVGEKTILGKRREFQMISDISYDLIKTVGLKGQTVYRDFCPMFDDGNGAHWLSGKKEIENPYYGKEMPGCGEMKETLEF